MDRQQTKRRRGGRTRADGPHPTDIQEILDELVNQARALGCHPAELLGEPWAIEREEIVFIEFYRSLHPLQQELLLKMVRGLGTK